MHLSFIVHSLLITYPFTKPVSSSLHLQLHHCLTNSLVSLSLPLQSTHFSYITNHCLLLRLPHLIDITLFILFDYFTLKNRNIIFLVLRFFQPLIPILFFQRRSPSPSFLCKPSICKCTLSNIKHIVFLAFVLSLRPATLLHLYIYFA